MTKVHVSVGQLWTDPLLDDTTPMEVVSFYGGHMWVELRNVKDGNLRVERYSRFGGCLGFKLVAEGKNGSG